MDAWAWIDLNLFVRVVATGLIGFGVYWLATAYVSHITATRKK